MLSIHGRHYLLHIHLTLIFETTMTSFWLNFIQPSELFQAAIHMTAAKYIILGTWAIYWIAFLLMKRRGNYTAKDAFDPRSSQPLTWVIILEFVVNTLFWASVGDIDNPALRESIWYPLSFTLGAIALIIGLMLSIVAWGYLGKNAGFLTRTDPNQPFARSGPYAYMRHPIYTGLVMLWFGSSLIYFSWAGIIMGVFVFIPLLRYRARIEEENLLVTFGDEYRRYKEVTWSLIPKPF